MRGREGTVAIIDASATEVIVWWVNIGEKPDPSMGRLAGAWDVPPDDHSTLESLVFRRIALATKQGQKALAKANVVPERYLDVNATLAAAIASRDKCQAAFDAEQAKRVPSKRLRPPRWPTFPAPLDVEKPPPWSTSQAPVREVQRTLSLAHWLSALCSKWEDLEAERLARPWLAALDGRGERELPVVMQTN
ncbi:MAG: hypothetical protein PSX37_00645 [bacterium]|nr:hypothetical protein [bacterium]